MSVISALRLATALGFVGSAAMGPAIVPLTSRAATVAMNVRRQLRLTRPCTTQSLLRTRRPVSCLSSWNRRRTRPRRIRSAACWRGPDRPDSLSPTPPCGHLGRSSPSAKSHAHGYEVTPRPRCRIAPSGRRPRSPARRATTGLMADLELLDCGDGRRLERFGSVVVDRPAPAAVMRPLLPEAEWHRAPLAYGRGGWARGGGQEPWSIRAGGLVLECRPATGGQVGVFPEHARTWAWLDGAVHRAADALGP